MKRVPEEILALPLQDRALMALRAAVRKAIAERRRLGLPVYVWSDGKVVELPSRKKCSPAKRPRSG